MTTLIVVGLGLILVLDGILSVPVIIRLESRPTVRVQWIFLRLRVQLDSGGVKTQVRLFGKPVRSESKTPTPKEEPDVKPRSPKPSRNGKTSWEVGREILEDAATAKILRQVWHFGRRSLRAFRLHYLQANIGLKDYYRQGMLMGWIAGLPRTKRFQLQGNFNAENNFVMIWRLSLLRILAAVLLLMLSFPYYRAIRLYLRIR